jgi:hypothetical protein
MGDPDPDDWGEEWVHNPGSEEDWKLAYWRTRALRAEEQLNS